MAIDFDRIINTLNECDVAFAVLAINDGLTPQAQVVLKRAWERVQDDLINSGFHGDTYAEAVRISRSKE